MLLTDTPAFSQLTDALDAHLEAVELSGDAEAATTLNSVVKALVAFMRESADRVALLGTRQN